MEGRRGEGKHNLKTLTIMSTGNAHATKLLLQPLNGVFSRITWVFSIRKIEPFWTLMK